MRETVLARRYAKALFELALEKNHLATIHGELGSLRDELEQNQELRQFIYSQNVSRKEKLATADALFQDRVSSTFFNFITVLLRKNREALYDTITVEFDRFVDRHNKKIRAATTTATPLDESSVAKLKSMLDKAFDADVELTNKVDPSILGGVIVSVQGRILDSSLQSQLTRFRNQLLERTNHN